MRPPYQVDVIHHIFCRHQVEVEVWPPRVELYFLDERSFVKEREVDLFDTQVRFEATAINSDHGVIWRVYAADGGGPGAGSIDATGLYQAPPKGDLKNGHTDVVVATSVEDPLRKAYAWVTLLGEGPLPAPDPRIEIQPKRADLYYRDSSVNIHNNYIDGSNKVQLFQAAIWNSDIQTVTWQVRSGGGSIASDGLYLAPGSGADHQVVVIRGTIGTTGIYDEARIVLRNYVWPGLQ